MLLRCYTRMNLSILISDFTANSEIEKLLMNRHLALSLLSHVHIFLGTFPVKHVPSSQLSHLTNELYIP